MSSKNGGIHGSWRVGKWRGRNRLSFTYLKDKHLPGKWATLEYWEIKGILLNLNRFPQFFFINKWENKSVWNSSGDREISCKVSGSVQLRSRCIKATGAAWRGHSRLMCASRSSPSQCFHGPKRRQPQLLSTLLPTPWLAHEQSCARWGSRGALCAHSHPRSITGDWLSRFLRCWSWSCLSSGVSWRRSKHDAAKPDTAWGAAPQGWAVCHLTLIKPSCCLRGSAFVSPKCPHVTHETEPFSADLLLLGLWPTYFSTEISFQKGTSVFWLNLWVDLKHQGLIQLLVWF